MRIEILRSAQMDLLEGFDFCERCEPGVGRYFLDCLYEDIEGLMISAGAHAMAHLHLHRSLPARFPFGIYYSVVEEVVRIHAVIDCRRHPSWIRHRLSRSDEFGQS